MGWRLTFHRCGSSWLTLLYGSVTTTCNKPNKCKENHCKVNAMRKKPRKHQYNKFIKVDKATHLPLANNCTFQSWCRFQKVPFCDVFLSGFISCDITHTQKKKIVKNAKHWFDVAETPYNKALMLMNNVNVEQIVNNHWPYCLNKYSKVDYGKWNTREEKKAAQNTTITTIEKKQTETVN